MQPPAPGMALFFRQFLNCSVQAAFPRTQTTLVHSVASQMAGHSFSQSPTVDGTH